MGEENGGYQPGEQEISAAENSMTSDQKMLSDEREERTGGYEIKDSELLQEVSRLELNESEGSYYEDTDHEGGKCNRYSPARISLKGLVSGHQIKLMKYFDDREGSTGWGDSITGTIDGVSLPSNSKQVAEVFEAYYNVRKGVQAENYEIRKLKEKETEEQKKKMAMNIGKVCDDLLGR